MILKHSNGNTYIYGSTSKPYYQVKSSTERLELPSGRTRSNYDVENDVWGEANTSTDSAFCNLSSNWTVLWSSFDIPSGSDTATEIYFYSSEPVLALIQLVNQNQSASNDVTSCSVTMTGCSVENTLILAYAVRGDGNDPTLSDGWVKLGGGNVDASAGNSYHKLYFAYKIVTAETETVTITQSVTSRIYAVCSEYSGVSSVLMRDDLASIGSSDYIVTGSKSKSSDIMIYGVTSSSYKSNGGRLQTVTPTDLVKIEGDSSQERLACWFDGGFGALEHSFRTGESTGSYIAILECVQLIPEGSDAPSRTSGYLIRSGDSLFTVTGGVLTAVEGSVSAELFRTHAMNKLPSSELLITLTDPVVLYWNETDKIRPLVAVVKGVPFEQVITTPDYNMKHPSIIGIEKAIVEATNDVGFAVSFDSGDTWLVWTGSAWGELSEGDTGMSAEMMNSISSEDWNSVATTGTFKFRAVLPTVNSTITSLVVDYLN